MNKKSDQFADIAMIKSGWDNPELIYPEPIEKAAVTLPADSGAQIRKRFEPRNKMSTAAELKVELAHWRERYKPFLRDQSPELKDPKVRIPIDSFDWRIEEKGDQSDFSRVLSGKGEWDRVSIPHFGGPLGKAVTYYRTTFSLTSLPTASESCYICFKGADYKAHVFINGAYTGSHEGFFAPFEFDITQYLRSGENTLVVKLENDFIFGGNVNAGSQGVRYEGDKLYAATGPGYDDPEMGWHHCPPGMGLYQDVYLEIRNRVHIHDLFVRPIVDNEGTDQQAEAWVEITSTHTVPQEVLLQLSVYGQNFQEAVIENYAYQPATGRAVGMGDSFTEQKLRSKGLLEKPVELQMEKGINLIKVPLVIPDARIWNPDTPWLYQLQVKLISSEGSLLDANSRQFGLRSFILDTECKPKGMFYLNGNPVRLRGANTMGHEQQCVMKKDWDQLIDDLLLARICNMNFLRLTQRPVQSEVYEYCDRLGLMTQSDLPLFGVLKRDKFCEAVKQVEEMERLVRSHPCNVIISYINEPFPNSGNKPHRHLSRQELLDFFTAADIVVKINNPDRVIKHVDGDYDPPSETLPDNHCYTFWYNGHGIEAGKLHKGHWMPVRKGWNYGCGEFGVEGLESPEIMRRYYPQKWLPQSSEEEQNWSPRQIVGAQTGNFHYLFYPTPVTLEEWVRSSQSWQAEGLKIMTEAFRRDMRMVTFAVHLFIDAFPSGWMKTIMDCERNPKPAYFAYRNALEPLMVNLRTDRFRYTAGEKAQLEIWICSDLPSVPEEVTLAYWVEIDGNVIISGEAEAVIPLCSSSFQGFLDFPVPQVNSAETVLVRAALIDNTGKVLNDTHEELKIFPVQKRVAKLSVWIPGEDTGSDLIQYFSMIQLPGLSGADVILVNDMNVFHDFGNEILQAVQEGATLLFSDLPTGDYEIGDNRIVVRECGMMPVHSVSLAEDSELAGGITSRDFRFWYDSRVDRISPVLEKTFFADGFTPIMTSGNINENGEWGPALAVAEKSYGKGRIVINQVLLGGRLEANPPAAILASRLIESV
jgi:hypothetical protein